MKQRPKTLEEHLLYTEQLARLSFFYARRFLLPRMNGKSLGDCLRDHTPLLYHALNFTDFESNWNSDDCNAILRKADSLAALPAEKFEEEMWRHYLHPLARKPSQQILCSCFVTC